MPNELKPCPFCGGEATLYRVPNTPMVLYGVKCEKCDCRIHPRVLRKDAVYAWNRRADNA